MAFPETQVDRLSRQRAANALLRAQPGYVNPASPGRVAPARVYQDSVGNAHQKMYGNSQANRGGSEGPNGYVPHPATGHFSVPPSGQPYEASPHGVQLPSAPARPQMPALGPPARLGEWQGPMTPLPSAMASARIDEIMSAPAPQGPVMDSPRIQAMREQKNSNVIAYDGMGRSPELQARMDSGYNRAMRIGQPTQAGEQPQSIFQREAPPNNRMQGSVPVGPSRDMSGTNGVSVTPGGMAYLPSHGTDGRPGNAHFFEGRETAPLTKGHAGTMVGRTASGALSLKGGGRENSPETIAKIAAMKTAREQAYKDTRALRAVGRNPSLKNRPAVIGALSRLPQRGPNGQLIAGAAGQQAVPSASSGLPANVRPMTQAEIAGSKPGLASAAREAGLGPVVDTANTLASSPAAAMTGSFLANPYTAVALGGAALAGDRYPAVRSAIAGAPGAAWRGLNTPITMAEGQPVVTGRGTRPLYEGSATRPPAPGVTPPVAPSGTGPFGVPQPPTYPKMQLAYESIPPQVRGAGRSLGGFAKGLGGQLAADVAIQQLESRFPMSQDNPINKTADYVGSYLPSFGNDGRDRPDVPLAPEYAARRDDEARANASANGYQTGQGMLLPQSQGNMGQSQPQPMATPISMPIQSSTLDQMEPAFGFGSDPSRMMPQVPGSPFPGVRRDMLSSTQFPKLTAQQQQELLRRALRQQSQQPSY